MSCLHLGLTLEPCAPQPSPLQMELAAPRHSYPQMTSRVKTKQKEEMPPKQHQMGDPATPSSRKPTTDPSPHSQHMVNSVKARGCPALPVVAGSYPPPKV